MNWVNMAAINWRLVENFNKPFQFEGAIDVCFIPFSILIGKDIGFWVDNYKVI